MRNFKILISLLIIFSMVFYITLPVFSADSSYIWSAESSDTLSTSSPIDNDENDTNDNSLNLESGSAILIEQSTGQVLYSHNPHEQLRPASVTKVMSILLIMEAIDSR